MRWFGILTIWGFFAGLALAFAGGPGLGPVLVVLPGGLHGIHAGDVIALLACVVGAARTTQAARNEWAARARR